MPEVAPAGASVGERAPSDRSDALDRFHLSRRATWICIAVALGALLALLLRNTWVFSVPVHEDTDFAANSILVNQAVHFNLLVGNYSREGFNHPGPAYLYIMSFGQEIFYSLLHVVPAQFNGQLIATFSLNAAMFGLCALIFYRHLRSWPIALLTLAIVLLLTAHTLEWASAWMPYLYAAPFLLAAVSGASVAAGALQDLPAFTFAVCLLMNGHVAFIGIIGLYAAVTLAGLALVTRRSGVRTYAAQGAIFWRLSAFIVVLFAIPIVDNLVFHWPGQWGLYWRYTSGNSSRHAPTLGQIASYVDQFWPGDTLAKLLVLLAGCLVAVFVMRNLVGGLRVFASCLLVGGTVLTLELAGYGWKGVDYLTFTYTGYFYYAVPPLFAALLCAIALVWIVGRSSRAADKRVHQTVTALVSILTAAALIGAVLPFSFTNTYRGDPNLPRMASVIRTLAARRGKAVAVNLGTPGLPASDWPDVAGFLVAASRDGYQPCVTNPMWTFMFTRQYICSPAQTRARWAIRLDTTTTALPRHAHQIFRDPTTVVVAG